MTDNKEREAFEAAWSQAYPLHGKSPFTRSLINPHGYAGTRINDGWKMWQARAALAASQEKAEPFAWYSAKVDDVITDVKKASRAKVQPWDAEHYDQPLYAAPVAAQASEPVAWLLENKRIGFWKAYATHAQAEDVLRHHKDVGCFDTAMTPTYSDIPQPSAEAARDAAYETAAVSCEAHADELLPAESLELGAMRGFMLHQASRIRALKSAPPQPAEQPSASPAALTDEQSDALIRLEDDLGCPRHNPSKVTVFADDLRTIIAIARAQGEQA